MKKRIFVSLLVFISTFCFSETYGQLENRFSLVFDRAIAYEKSFPRNVPNNPNSYYFSDLTIEQLEKMAAYCQWISETADALYTQFASLRSSNWCNQMRQISNDWYQSYERIFNYVRDNFDDDEKLEFILSKTQYKLMLEDGASRL